MALYKVQRMTEADYHKYMAGSYYYQVEEIYITAETAEEAVLMAKKAGYFVNNRATKVENRA